MATEKISNLFDVIGAIPAYASGDQLLMRDVSDSTGDPGGTAVTGTFSGMKTAVSTSMTISGSSDCSSGAFYQYYSWGGGISYGGLVCASDQWFGWQSDTSNPVGGGTKDLAIIRVVGGVARLSTGTAAGVGSWLCGALVEANTAGSGAPNVLLNTESGTVLTNEGAGAENYHTLPTAAAGLRFGFWCQNTNGIRITASAGDTISLGLNHTTTAAGYIKSFTAGSRVVLIAMNATEWVVEAEASGDWTDGTWWHSSLSAYGGIYFSVPATTACVAATPIKVAGTTAAQDGALLFTAGTANRLTYTGKATRPATVTATFSVDASSATMAKFHIYKNGSLVTGATITRTIANTDIGTMALIANVSLAENDYIELWCQTDDGDDLTVEDGVLTVETIHGD